MKFTGTVILGKSSIVHHLLLTQFKRPTTKLALVITILLTSMQASMQGR